jgi:hypothetical protein
MEVVTSHPIVDAVLNKHLDALGSDLPAYRNHMLRSLNYHQTLLKTPVPDSAALAWAVHDLGVWTANTLDYLEPSANLATAHAGEFGITDIDEVRTMAVEHHKLRPTGNGMVDAFRAADVADASRGLPPAARDRACPACHPAPDPAAADAALVAPLLEVSGVAAQGLDRIR